jgi:hypothetical protein
VLHAAAAEADVMYVEQHDWHVMKWRLHCLNHTRQYDQHVRRYWVDRLSQMVDQVLVRVRMV